MHLNGDAWLDLSQHAHHQVALGCEVFHSLASKGLRQVGCPRDLRDNPAVLTQLPIVAPGGVQLTLGQIADLPFSEGPQMLCSDDARLSTYVYIDVASRDLGSVVSDLQHAVG